MLEATKDAKDLNPLQKADTMTNIRKQVRDVVDEIHGRKRGFTPQQRLSKINQEIDIVTDSTGNPTAKLQTKTKGKQEVMKANVTTADVERLKETFLPDRFRFDEAIRLALDLPYPEPEPEPEPPKPKKKKHHVPPIVLPPPPAPPQIVQPAPIDIESPDPMEINLSFDIEEGEALGPQEVEVEAKVPPQRPPK